MPISRTFGKPIPERPLTNSTAYAPKAYRDTRGKTVEHVERGLLATEDLTKITPEIVRESPAILPTLRMSTCPPLARDRLIGLADSSKNLVGSLEEGKLPPQLSTALLDEHLGKITGIITRMLDVDIFPWLGEKRRPTEEERFRSSLTVYAVPSLTPLSGTHKRSASLP
jgi:hypothetical protein